MDNSIEQEQRKCEICGKYHSNIESKYCNECIGEIFWYGDNFPND